MTGDVIDTAGILELTEPTPAERRREQVRAIRAIFRKIDASDDEYDDALEALMELSRDPGESETPSLSLE